MRRNVIRVRRDQVDGFVYSLSCGHLVRGDLRREQRSAAGQVLAHPNVINCRQCG